MWCCRRLFRYLSAFGNNRANDLVTEHLLITVTSCIVPIMRENRFLLFLNHLRLPYSIPKSFALLLSFQYWRHTFATLQLEHGTDIYTVKDMLGHTNVRTTQIYGHIVDPSKRKAAEAIYIDGLNSLSITDKS